MKEVTQPLHVTLTLALVLAFTTCPLLGATTHGLSKNNRAKPDAPMSLIPHDEAVIRTPEQLDAYLRRHQEASEPTPFDRLSPGARERFFLGLNWGSKGLGGFNWTDLVDELSQDEIHAVLALFGSDVAANAPKSRVGNIGTDNRPIGPAKIRTSDIDRRYNLFYREILGSRSLEDAARTALISNRFDKLFPEARDPVALRKIDDHDLRLLWRAANQSANWSAQSAHTDTALAIFTERDRRGLVDPNDIRAVRNLLLAARRFDAARQVTEMHPDAGLAPLPVFHDSIAADRQQATAWQLDNSGKLLTRTAIDLSPTQILVTAGCHFSIDAAEDISSDPVLGPIFAAHAHWLVQAPGIEDIEAVHEWNRRFPDARVNMIHDPGEWRIFPTWSMPAFYIVRNGKVMESVVGWPRSPATNRQPLIDALRRAGLLGSETKEGMQPH